MLIRSADLELADGLNALTGETGAGKTIFAQAIGLLLGSRGDAAAIGPAGDEAYVEAELELPDGLLEDEGLAAIAELRPEDEPALVVARRIFADGRTRAYAWGRAVAREDMAAAVERLIAMSGQFEQRRLARPSYQLDLLDTFAGAAQTARRREVRDAWRALVAARRRHEEVAANADAAAAEMEELRLLAESTADLEPGEEDTLRLERARLVHAADLVAAVATAVEALAPDDGEGAVSLTAQAERALEPAAAIAPELDAPLGDLRDLAVRLRETGSDLRRALSAFDTDPARLETVEGRLDQIAELRRRFRCDTLTELVSKRDEAIAVLERLGGGGDPVAAAAEQVAAAEARYAAVAEALGAARRAAAEPFGTDVTAELAGLGMGEGEFQVELPEHEEGPSGREQAVFLVRLNQGLPFAPVADTASGGELSRIALALATVGAAADGGSQTLVFDEIDAGIGGQTAHHVAETLQRLATRVQVVTITHLPQIASVADGHFRVEKVQGDPTQTLIERLGDADRKDELERMLGGSEFVASVSGSSGSDRMV